MTMKEIKTPVWYRKPAPTSTKRGMAIADIGASLIYWLAAHSYFLPGLYLQRYSTLFGLSLAAKRHADLPTPLVQRLLNGTLESTTYFEFDFAWRAVTTSEGDDKNYLDVLSPWLLPVLLMQRRRISRAIVVSPRSAALQAFRQLSEAAGFGSRCETIGGQLEDCSLAPGSFDVITSISGPAQVTNDSALVAKMWTLLKPGGLLVISLPCSVNAAGWISNDNWNEGADIEAVLSRPRMYDPQLLQERIFSILGGPASAVVYGETAKRELRQTKRDALVPGYPPPREPLAMARDWRCFSRVQDLPGRGVIAMSFNKAFAS
jgi:SAM-dependent methyltransferase